MATTRRDFLRRGACALGGLAFMSSLKEFALANAVAQGAAAAPASDYRALVCVFLSGGNDGNNLVVPLDAEYDAYAAVRSPNSNVQLGLAKSALLPVNPPSLARPFGFHPNMPEMQALFEQQKLAVVCNTGPLVEPLTRTTYQNGTGRRPYQLFSHSDQVTQWQSAVASAPSQTGWGGRTADLTAPLNGAATFPQLVSISGVSVFVTSSDTRPLAIADARTSLAGVLPLTLTKTPGNSLPVFTDAEVAARRAAFDALRALDQEATLVKASSETVARAIQTSQALSTDPVLPALQAGQIDFPATSNGLTLGVQLKQVAKLISLRDVLGMKRQIFFCSLGAFDTHTNQRGTAAATQDSLLQHVSQSLKAFYDALTNLGIQNGVTTFTLSDFGRTLQPAGTGSAVGSDHAWGNHHLVLGGAVRGGDFYGAFPRLALSGPDDADTRGRWIPTTSVEQFAATLAAWYGLAPTDVPLVYPLINRFSTPNLGFMG